MKKQTLLKIILIFILDIILIGLLSYLISWYRLGLTRVYVSAYDIGEREKIDKLYLKTILVPKAYVSDDIYLEEKDIVNKYTKLNVIVPKGSLFYKSFLEDFSDMKDSSHFLLEDNQVTYDLYVKDIDVNPANILKGMRCDLYFTLNRQEVISDLLIEDAKIIGLYDLNNQQIVDNHTTLNIISIAVDKDMVTYLNKALAIGEIKLIIGDDLYSDNEVKINLSETILKYLS